MKTPEVPGNDPLKHGERKRKLLHLDDEKPLHRRRNYAGRNSVDPLRFTKVIEVRTPRKMTRKLTLAREAVEQVIREQQRRDEARIPNAGKRYGLGR